jgi:hypothetical protein
MQFYMSANVEATEFRDETGLSILF